MGVFIQNERVLGDPREELINCTCCNTQPGPLLGTPIETAGLPAGGVGVGGLGSCWQLLAVPKKLNSWG